MNRVQVGDMEVRIEMIKLACVTGRVYDAGSNQAVPGFTCSVLRTTPPGTGAGPQVFENTAIEQVFSGRSDGSFELCGLHPGSYVISASSQGFAPVVSETFTVAEGQPVPAVVIRLSQGGTIKGRVLDPQGAPVAGVQISSHDNEFVDVAMDAFLGGIIATQATERKARSDSQGYFELGMLTPGVYQLRIAHPAFTGDVVRNLRVAEGKPLDAGSITLRPGGTVKGTVYDQAGRAVVRGFVQLHGHDGLFSYQSRADGEGRYLFEHVRPGAYKLSATRLSPTGGGDAFTSILDQQHSEVQINVVDGTTVSRDLNLGN
jgi:hypothetical protein